MAVQKGFKIDVNQCISCRSCEMACKVEYNLRRGQGRRRRVIEKTVDEGDIRTFFISLACNHCANPACLMACPKGAYSKAMNASNRALNLSSANPVPASQVINNDLSTYPEGVVLHDPAKCIGCRRCEWACPYGAPQFDAVRARMHKCEMCWQRVKSTSLHSSRRVPACVATCIGGAIKLMDIDPRIAASADAVTEKDYFLRDDNLVANQFKPGTADGTGVGFSAAGDAGRGSSYLADRSLTNPAVRVRNRRYINRDGTVS